MDRVALPHDLAELIDVQVSGYKIGRGHRSHRFAIGDCRIH